MKKVTLALLLLLVPAGNAAAQDAAFSGTAGGSVDLSTDASVEASSDEPGPLVLGAEVGGIFPQPFTELGTHVAFGIEVGYVLPPWGRHLEVFLAAGFSPPSRSFTDGPFDGEVLQQELHFSLGPRWRFMRPTKKWNVSLAAGGRLFLLQSFSNGDRAGSKFAEFREQSTQMGFFVALGGEYRLGPGALLLDVDLGWSDLPHDITGDVSTGNITATLGYRFFLL